VHTTIFQEIVFIVLVHRQAKRIKQDWHGQSWKLHQPTKARIQAWQTSSANGPIQAKFFVENQSANTFFCP